MADVSRPMLIALAATVALLAVWLVALRPKPVAVEKTPLGPTKAIPAAKKASAASEAANAKLQAAAKAGDAGPAAPAAVAESVTAAKAVPGSATAKAGSPSPVRPGETRRERVVLREIRQGKVVVMLFWSSAGADDVATRRALRSVNRRNGKVRVHVIPIGRVGDYDAITRGLTIAQSPTTLIIGRNGRARTIVGLTEPTELRQAVTDAIAKR